MRLEMIRAGDRLLAKKIISNMTIIKEAINDIINDHVKKAALTASQFSTEVIKWLNCFMPGYVRTDINHNTPYIASETAIRYSENRQTDINPWPHKWVSGTTHIEFDLENKEIRFYRSSVLYKKVTSTGWV